MNIDKYLERIERIDQLIRLKATGSPKEFARKLGISKSTLYEYLKNIKNIGADITYDKNNNSFRYLENGKLKKLCFEKFEEKEMEKITGGAVNYLMSPIFSDYKILCLQHI